MCILFIFSLFISSPCHTLLNAFLRSRAVMEAIALQLIVCYLTLIAVLFPQAVIDVSLATSPALVGG